MPKTVFASHSVRTSLMLVAACVCFGLSGCTSVLSPIDTIPAERVPPQFLAEPQTDKRPIDVSRLRQVKPKSYILDDGDVLGVFIEEVLGAAGEAPPVRIPEEGSDLAPAMGYPVPVREDGTISLPLVDPIPVRGLTIQQAEQLIKRTYTEGEEPILKSTVRFITTIMRKRTHRVFVVRQDGGVGANQQVALQQLRSGINTRSDFSSRGFVLQLPAGENDVFTALSQTGGLPGINAKAEVRILRGDRLRFADRDRELLKFYEKNDGGEFPYGIIPEAPEDDQSTIRIPMRLRPNEVPNIRPEDVILRDGDIVYVDSRETDVYYTGGLLTGGEFPLPRDYDLDVLTAIARAGFSAGVGQNRNGILGSAGASVPPSQLIILRQIPGKQQLAIEVDLNEAINDPRSRILVRPGDTLILRFRPREEIINFISNTFFTFCVRQLFR